MKCIFVCPVSYIGLQARTQVRRGEGTGTPVYFHPLALDSISTRRGSLVLLNGSSAIEVFKVQLSSGYQWEDFWGYIPTSQLHLNAC